MCFRWLGKRLNEIGSRDRGLRNQSSTFPIRKKGVRNQINVFSFHKCYVTSRIVVVEIFNSRYYSKNAFSKLFENFIAELAIGNSSLTVPCLLKSKSTWIWSGIAHTCFPRAWWSGSALLTQTLKNPWIDTWVWENHRSFKRFKRNLLSRCGFWGHIFSHAQILGQHVANCANFQNHFVCCCSSMRLYLFHIFIGFQSCGSSCWCSSTFSNPHKETSSVNLCLW